MAKMNKAGGPAFPGHVLSDAPYYAGMSMRDYFAGQALNGLITGLSVQDVHPGDGNAEDAYRLADAMIAAREK